jgi:LacI family transcriptional regulator
MNDVARHAGVSLKTVSRVVNGIATVDPGLAERVRTSIRALGFERNAAAATLRSGHSARTVGLITADLSNSFYSALAGAVVGVARERGYQVIMASSEEDPERERSLALDLCERRVSGLVVVPTGADLSYLKREVDRGTPVVFVDRPGSGLAADVVVGDNRGGARAAIAQLVARGHSRIGLLTDALSIYTMRERFEGARDALTAAGLPLDPSLWASDVHSPHDAIAATGRMLALPDPPTALVCANNRSTIGAVEALWHSGRHAEVVGFDDVEFARFLPQRVTIVDYDAAELGRRAAELLFERIQGSIQAPREHVVPTRLVTRGGRNPAA